MAQKVILNKDVENLGIQGDVVEVKPGYARNWLFPKNLAFAWTEKAEKANEHVRAKRREKEEALIKQASDLKEAFSSQVFVISKRVSKNNKIYGSVTKKDVLSVISKGRDYNFDEHDITLDEAIKTPGSYYASVKLYGGETAEIKLLIEGVE